MSHSDLGLTWPLRCSNEPVSRLCQPRHRLATCFGKAWLIVYHKVYPPPLRGLLLLCSALSSSDLILSTRTSLTFENSKNTNKWQLL